MLDPRYRWFPEYYILGFPPTHWWLLFSSPQICNAKVTLFFSTLYLSSLPCCIISSHVLTHYLPTTARPPLNSTLSDQPPIVANRYFKIKSSKNIIDKSSSTLISVYCIHSLASCWTPLLLSHPTSSLSENSVGFTVYPEYGYS